MDDLTCSLVCDLPAKCDRLQAQNSQMRDVLEKARQELITYALYDEAAHGDGAGGIYHMPTTVIGPTIAKVDAALSFEPIEWHNPVDTAEIARLTAEHQRMGDYIQQKIASEYGVCELPTWHNPADVKRIAELEKALADIAKDSPPDDWEYFDEWGEWVGYEGLVKGVDPSNSGDVHTHGWACGRWAAAKIARAALKGDSV
jgi:hypothetical protein